MDYSRFCPLFNNIFVFFLSAFIQYNLETKEETKRRMLTMLENISGKMAEQQLSLTKVKYTQNELEMYQ